MRARWLTLGFAMLTGCFLSRGTPLARRIEPGRPQADDGGEAYLVWSDPAGWHLRARTDGVPHRFHGVVGTSAVKPVGIAPSAIAKHDGQVAFSFEATAGEVGFDWSGGCAEMDLFVDGETRPLLVRVGAYGASPARIPFELCR
jgi:hypothetical protein